jgi:hypothetical protein
VKGSEGEWSIYIFLMERFFDEEVDLKVRLGFFCF